MSTTPYVCCCGDQGLYYALKCPELTSNYCCPTDCAGAPARIDLCPSYLVSLGLTVPLDLDNYCYVLAYDCCAYVITAFVVTPCPPNPLVYPTNVGRLVSVTAKGEIGCCYTAGPLPPLPVGSIGDVTVGECGPAVSGPDPEEFPCHEVIAQCYDLCDQLGTVKERPMVFESSMTICNNAFAIDPSTRCDDQRIDGYTPITRTVKHAFSLCNQAWYEIINGVRTLGPQPAPLACNYYQHQTWEYFLSCASGGCWPVWRADCCTDVDNCAIDPTACDAQHDPAKTWESDACYDARDTNILYSPNPVHEESMFDVIVDYCFLESQEVDWNNQAALDAWLATFVTLSTDQWPTCWDVPNAPNSLPTLKLEICGVTIQMVSGTAEDIMERINYRLGLILRAEPSPLTGKWAKYFWFGKRQSCEPCSGSVELPPRSEGDTLILNGVVNDPSAGGVRISFIAQTPRKYAGVWVKMFNPLGDESCPEEGCAPNTDPVSVAMISGNGAYPYDLHVLSVPEYSSGERYNWVRVEELAGTVDICTAPSTTATVTKCVSVAGWPLDDVIVTPPVGPPYVAQYGWHTLGLGIGPTDPQSRTRCYPFDYTPAPCCPPEHPDCAAWYLLYPLPIPCVLDCFQNGLTYCETNAQALVLQPCGTADPYPIP